MRRGMSLVELLVVIAILAVLMGLLLPAVQNVRAASARARCQNNLKQIALGLHQYHDAHGTLPAGCSLEGGNSRQPFMGWAARILPHVEQGPLWQRAYDAFEQKSYFFTLVHQPVLGTAVPLYVCPSDGRLGAGNPVVEHYKIPIGMISYCGVAGLDRSALGGVLFTDSKVRLGDVTDGSSNTLLVGERPPSADLWFGWWYAGVGQGDNGSAETTLGVRETCVTNRYAGCVGKTYEFTTDRASNPCAAFHYWSPHSGGAWFAWCDGSVRFVTYAAKEVMPALGSKSGGEAVTTWE